MSAVNETLIRDVVSEVLGRLGFDDYVIRLNHRKALGALLESAGVPAALHGEALIAIDKLDKIGVGGVEKELTDRGVEPAAIRACLDFFSGVTTELPNPGTVINRLRSFVQRHQSGPSAVDQLDTIVRLADSGPAHGRIHIDPFNRQDQVPSSKTRLERGRSRQGGQHS